MKKVWGSIIPSFVGGVIERNVGIQITQDFSKWFYLVILGGQLNE